jgi:hypothetical protein
MSTYKCLNTKQIKVFTETNECKQKEMLNILCSEIRLYFLDNTDNNIILTIMVPIKIDGVTVYVCISKDNEGMYTYRLETVNALFKKNNDNRQRIVVYVSKNYFENLIELFDELNMIKNTYVFFECNFMSPKKYEFCIENPEICLKKTEMCSVCFENTYIYTVCKHPLCFKCRDKLIEQSSLSKENVNCPVCRRPDVVIVYMKEFQQEDYEYEDMEEMVDFIALDDDTILKLKKK